MFPDTVLCLLTVSAFGASCKVRDVLSFLLVDRCLVVCCTGVGRQALHSSRTVASSTTAASASQEEGLHAGPLHHNFCEYICDVAVYFGGGRIALRPSSSQQRRVLCLLLLRLARRTVRSGEFHLLDLIRPGARCSFSSWSTVVSCCDDCV